MVTDGIAYSPAGGMGAGAGSSLQPEAQSSKGIRQAAQRYLLRSRCIMCTLIAHWSATGWSV